MQVTIRREGAELSLAGWLDARGAAPARLALQEAVRRGEGDLVVDIAGVELVDATGLGVLVGAHRSAQRSGRVLVLQDPSERLRRVLAVTRLDRVLAVTRTPLAV